MGAEDFIVSIEGRTPGAAFDVAVNDARWAHGNAGYTGTIAEKGDFYMVNRDVEAARLIALYEGELKFLTAEAQKRAESKHAKAWREKRYEDAEDIAVNIVRNGDTPMADACTVLRRAIRRQIAHLRQSGKNRSLAICHGQSHYNIGPYHDKWGNAACVPLTFRASGKNTYLFFGCASS